MSNEKQVTLTHNAGCEWIGKDGIKRSIQVGKYATEGFVIQIQSWWNGEDAEPMTTKFGLGAEAFDMLTNGLMEFRMRLNDFEIKDENEEEI